MTSNSRSLFESTGKKTQNLLFTTAATHLRQVRVTASYSRAAFHGDVQQSPGHSHAAPCESEESVWCHMENWVTKKRDAVMGRSSPGIDQLLSASQRGDAQ